MLSGLRAVVSSEGEHGENLIREDEAGFTVLLRRPVRDLRRQLPNIEVGALCRQHWPGKSPAQREFTAASRLVHRATVSLILRCPVCSLQQQGAFSWLAKGQDLTDDEIQRPGFTLLPSLYPNLLYVQVGITIPSIKATVSDREYRLITSVAGQNFGEELRLPGAALWLEEAYRPESFEDAEAERAGSGQVCLHFAPQAEPVKHSRSLHRVCRTDYRGCSILHSSYGIIPNPCKTFRACLPCIDHAPNALQKLVCLSHVN